MQVYFGKSGSRVKCEEDKMSRAEIDIIIYNKEPYFVNVCYHRIENLI
jgi:transcription antitermination factor NusA-like protein